MRITGILLLLFSFALVINGCSKEKDEAKNLEQIYAEKGIPVKVQTVQPAPFRKASYYNAILRGFRESSVFAALGDRIDKIYVKVGDYVQKDQVLLSFPTDNPTAQYYQAKVAFENARRTIERMKELLKSGGISQQDFDNAQTQFEVAWANWDAVRQAVKVKAPIGGYVTKINVRETDNVDVKAELVTITQTDRMKAEIWIAESEINEIHDGLPAVARWNGFEIKGKVIQVNMAMDLKQRAFKAILEFDNPDNTVKSGVTAEIEIVTIDREKAIVVDQTSLLKEGGQRYVFVNNNGKAEKRPVKIGSQSGAKVLLLEGLKPGDQLIIEGQFLLKDGSKINIIG
ncbi:efflux RND transporter periplasmic adaptor subunit [Calditrichota bacterium LG25]